MSHVCKSASSYSFALAVPSRHRSLLCPRSLPERLRLPTVASAVVYSPHASLPSAPASTGLGISPLVLVSQRAGVSLDRRLELSSLLRLALKSQQYRPLCARPRSSSPSSPLPPARPPLSLQLLEPSRGIASREGLALPVSLCGGPSIPVRGGSRIATLHQSNLLLIAAAAIFSASLSPSRSLPGLCRVASLPPAVCFHTLFRTASFHLLGCQAALWLLKHRTAKSRYLCFLGFGLD